MSTRSVVAAPRKSARPSQASDIGGGGRRSLPWDDPPALLSDVRVRGFLAGALAVTAAQLVTDFMPRGPATAPEALFAMIGTALVGVAAGLLVARRWVLLLAPVAFAIVFEISQVGLEGPTVDAPRLTMIGLLAWGLVRLALGLLLLAPMVVGAAWGVHLAPWRSAPVRRFRAPGLIVLGVMTVALVALGIGVAAPATTAPILGPDGQPARGSIAELTTIEIDGLDHALMIRGVSTDNPVLLHLAGGPGGSDVGAMRLDTGLEEHFVVVTWDQRGTGKSYRAIEPMETLTLESAITDTLAVTDYLRERFDEERIVLTGQSWGTIPAVLAAQRHPERYRAVVSTGQMVDVAETDRIFYDDVLAAAHERGETAIEERLLTIGPPPYADFEDALTLNDAERQLFGYPEFDGRTEMAATIWGAEYSFMDKLGAIRGLADTYTRLYPQLETLDLRGEVPALEVPVVVVVGEHESRGRVAPAREWFDALAAPDKQWVELPASGHRASFERPAEYTDLLTRVLAETAP